MLKFYTILFYLLTPFILLRLYWRGIKAPEYRKRWLERLAIYQKQYSANVIWIHAVSVGEAEAVFPLVKQLQAISPSNNILITTTTPTGSARVQAVLNNTVEHVYLPYDLPVVVKQFLSVFKPKIAIIMEKEIWPNLYIQCADNHIPLMIINARLSANSAKGYKKIAALVKPALSKVCWVLTQTKEDRRRFIDIGARGEKVSVSGNIKFDLAIDNNIVQQAKKIKKECFINRFVWIIASTHEGEESIFLELYLQLKKQIPELLLLIVPRHPERFNSVKSLVEEANLNVCMRSTGQLCTDATDVYIADTMGELKLLYGVADICFVAGSMVPVGGHNVLEPAVMEVPVLFGPYMMNFKEIARNVIDIGAAIQCETNTQILDAVLRLYDDSDFSVEMVEKAALFIQQSKGATEKTVGIIMQTLNE
ncbi:MAG: 3-deoxy-D-manno-octulosonic acid transferase [Methylococcales symbiont of Hymedesmia sp. n. MRB-2018]|nr:MAG: 3-deoxy-D-manno-octulosonic acid transferase [Methylococcales symbiont of Hymedesmia sp. n. MRB-2018]